MSNGSILSTLTPNSAKGMVTAAELANQIGAPGTVTPLVTSAALAASRTVESYCKTEFREQTYVEKWHNRLAVCAPFDIRLKRVPVASITSIVDAEAATVNAADYELIDPQMGRLRFYETDAFALSTERWTLTITYVAGYTNVTLPEDLRQAVLDVGQKIYRGSGTTETDIQSESIGDWSATYGRSFVSASARSILDDYRILNLW